MITVSELTKELKIFIEEEFSQVTVIGEISGFKPHVSGHWYFNLKDSDALICAAMWRGYNQYVFFTPQNGMKVVLNGRITVYPPRGSYQIDVRSMKPAGVGELQEAFEKLKQKLSNEGLFDEEIKKPIPVMPGKIGIITAIDGAALKDMISVARRRYPLAELIISPSKVQGNGAAENIAENIIEFNRLKNVDVIIAARGGGSIEDLWAFNEEIVARAIYNSAIPIISGVGHESDFTIADYAADLRAPTPTAAMELATPDKRDFFAFINEFSYNAENTLLYKIKREREKIRTTMLSYGFKYPINLIRNYSQTVDNLLYKISNSAGKKVEASRAKLILLQKMIESHDIKRALKKGFVLVKQDSKFITRFSAFNAEKKSEIIFYDGSKEINPS